MQAYVEYVECLSLLMGKSSYNLAAAEEMIWAPWFVLPEPVVWNLLSWWIKKKKIIFPPYLCSETNKQKRGIGQAKHFWEFSSYLCCSKDSQLNINAFSYSTPRSSKEHIFTPIISSPWEHTKILEDEGFGCTFILTMRFAVRQLWHHFGVAMNKEHLTKFPQGWCSENHNQSQNSWDRLSLQMY